MIEELSFSIAEQDSLAIIENKFADPIWGELTLLLIKDIKKPTPEEVEAVSYINMQINYFLEMIVLKELKGLLEIAEKPLKSFVQDLNSKSGEKQITMIDEVSKGKHFFWTTVEGELIDQCLKPILKRLQEESQA